MLSVWPVVYNGLFFAQNAAFVHFVCRAGRIGIVKQ